MYVGIYEYVHMVCGMCVYGASCFACYSKGIAVDVYRNVQYTENHNSVPTVCPPDLHGFCVCVFFGGGEVVPPHPFFIPFSIFSSCTCAHFCLFLAATLMQQAS